MGKINSHHSLETRQKMSDSHKKFHQLNPEAAANRAPGAGIYKREPWMQTGKYFRTEENRKNIGLVAKGRVDSEETREKKRQHMIAEWKKNPNRHGFTSRKGIKHTPETLIKLRESHLGIGKGVLLKPMWSIICLMCKQEKKFPSGTRKGQMFCCRKCYVEYKHLTAKKNRKPYSKEFNDKLKAEIRDRDGYKCQICNIPEIECSTNLSVHHIDYDRLNAKKDNLIALCNRCHLKTNRKREYWKQYFQKLMKLKEVKQNGRIIQ